MSHIAASDLTLCETFIATPEGVFWPMLLHSQLDPHDPEGLGLERWEKGSPLFPRLYSAPPSLSTRHDLDVLSVRTGRTNMFVQAGWRERACNHAENRDYAGEQPTGGE